MKRRSALEVYLRSGRRTADMPPMIEVKFNPNHDPTDGRFTFSGQGSQSGDGGSVLRTMGLPVDGGPNQDALVQATSPRRPRLPQRGPATKLKPVPGYLESGARSWRAANDQVFIDAANTFNSQRGLKPGDPKYIDPQFIKAWAMVESGGESDKSAFLRDPLQVNNPGDWNTDKLRLLNLRKDQQMTPELSAESALKWLEYKGTRRNPVTLRPTWLGWEHALKQYNGRNALGKDGVPLKVWYRRRVMELYSATKTQRQR